MSTQLINVPKAYSTYQRHINRLDKKTYQAHFNIQVLKLETKELHHFLDKLMATGRITLKEIQDNVHTRKEAINIVQQHQSKYHAPKKRR